MKNLKPALIVYEQLEKLREKGVTIEDDVHAAGILNRISYYRLLGYLWPFKDSETGTYNGIVALVFVRYDVIMY